MSFITLFVRLVSTLEKEKNFSLIFYVIMYFDICFY